MKKFFALFLLAALILCGCNPTPQDGGTQPTTTAPSTAPASGFEVGFGEANITPDFQVDLAGYGNNATRLSTGFKTYIYAHVLAVRDGSGTTAVLIGMDAGSCNARFYAAIKQYCQEAHNIPGENMLLSAGHQHSCPGWGDQYFQFAEKKIKAAIDDALEDLAPAEMYINSVQTTALSFVRNYIANDPAGSIVGDNYNDAIGKEYGYKDHESESDKEMQLLKFTREGKKDIIVVNFQAHPHMGTSSTDTSISADWPGVMRDTVMDELDCNVMYFSGAGGNLNSTSRIESENISADFREHGRRAAKYVINAQDSYTKAETGNVICKQLTVAYNTNHENDHLLDAAKYVHSVRLSQGIPAGNQVLVNYPGIHSVYHAECIIEQAAVGPTRELTIGAITFGDVAFTVHPYEMFDTNGMDLKTGTVGNDAYPAEGQLENPFKMTVITTMSNGSNGYLPSRIGCTNGGYSTDITYFAYGTAEILVGDYLELLNELHS